MYIVISYDITSDKRRNKIHNLLKDYGTWVQYSVFECNISKKEFLRLQDRLQDLSDKNTDDSVRFYILCEDCKQKITRIGGVVPPESKTIIIS